MKKMLTLLWSLNMCVNTTILPLSCGAKTEVTYDPNALGNNDNYMPEVPVVPPVDGWIDATEPKPNENLNNDPPKNEAIVQNPKAEIMKQYSKALFANQYSLKDLGVETSLDEELQNSHYSSSYYFNTLKQQKISNMNLDLGFDDEFKAYSKSNFEEVYSKYFESSLINENSVLDNSVYQNKVYNPKSSIPELLEMANKIMPTLANSLSDFSGSGIKDLLMLLFSFQGVLSNLPEEANVALSTLTDNDSQALKDISSALNFDSNDYTYVDAIQHSIIALAKSVNGMRNKSTTGIKNFDSASKALGVVLKELTDGKISFDNDIKESLKQVKYIGGIVKFVRVMFLYLDSFSESDLTEKTLSVDDVLKVKQGAIKTQNGEKVNSINMQKWIRILKLMCDDQNGQGLRIIKNIVCILFSTHDTPGLNSKETNLGGFDQGWWKPNVNYSNSKEIYAKIFGYFITEVAGERISTISGSFFPDNFIKSLLNIGVGYESGGTVSLFGTKNIRQVLDFLSSWGTIVLPKMITDIFKKIKNAGEWEEFKQDWLKCIWYDTKGGIGISIKKILNQPLSELSKIGESFGIGANADDKEKVYFDDSKDYLGHYFSSKSLNDYLTDLQNYLPEKQDIIVDFDSFKNLLNSLASSQTSLKNALENKQGLLVGLGLKKSGNSVKGSSMDLLTNTLNEYQGLFKGLVSFADKKINELISINNNMIKEYQKIMDSLIVETTVVDQNKYEYLVSYNDKRTKFTIELQQNEQGKSYISSLVASQKDDEAIENSNAEISVKQV
ncbi:hypothetical protein SHELI_v1c09350 [Spiroplasma helicoides]|uniref:MOLPALP family lipoprotein n=1 Tax=Spiroplasma helicoides TaxID=216938 RepID=A0A1B3SLS8_9MOLU|nr:hypothetical protein [Spiroplasma helicoides]AOG60884.1 hypothetical protein SHELI_v1c09350 [Spiroplasma helicoides]